MFDHFLGLDGISERLVHGLAFAIEHPAAERAGPIWRAALQADADQQRTMEPAAVLIAAFEIHVGRPCKTEALIEHGEMTRTGIEPYVQDVGLFAEFAAAAFGACGPGGQQLGGGALIPDVGAILAEKRDDAIEDG